MSSKENQDIGLLFQIGFVGYIGNYSGGTRMMVGWCVWGGGWDGARVSVGGCEVVLSAEEIETVRV